MGGIGVQRVVKFCKYLPLYNYLPIVVAAKSTPANHSTDSTLMGEVKDIQRYLIETPNRNLFYRHLADSILGRMLKMDKAPWYNDAIKTCNIVINKEKPQLIYTTVSPFPMANVAREVSAEHNIPWVLDMRDPWALDPIQYYPTKFHYWHDLYAMKRACLEADAVIMNTPDAHEAIISNFSDINPTKFSYITNGWDADDFEKFHFPNVIKDLGKPLTIVHTGVFQTEYAMMVNPTARKNIKGRGKTIKDVIKFSVGNPNLLTRTPHYLFKAISQLLEEQKISKSDIRLVFAGSYTSEDKKLAKFHQVEEMVDFLGYVNHDESVKLLNKADVLFLPLHEPEKMLPLIVPGKTYEYLAAKRPILATLPEGDTRRFVKESGLGYICDPSSVEQIALSLYQLVHAYKSPAGISVNPNLHFIDQFERKKLTEQLVTLFNETI